MTSAEEHPTPEVLAEFAAGSLGDAATGAHVHDCPSCQHVVARLGDVTTALQELPAEMPVPDDVSAQISAALSVEHESRGGAVAVTAVTAESAAAADPDTGGETGTVAWFRRRVPQTLAAAASLAVIGFAAVVATSGDDGGGTVASDVGSAEGGENDDASSGPAVAQQEGAATDGDDPGEAGPAPSGLDTAVRDVWQNGSELSPECGTTLAADVGLSLAGSAEFGSGVLVVLDNAPEGQLEGRLVSTCGSSTDEALAEPVTVPRPE